MIFEENNKAIYIQIADRISDEIVKGNFAEGERIPSVRDMATSLEVNANTAMRAYDRLQQEGLLVNKRGIGFFVASGARIRIINQRGQYLIDNQLDALFGLMKHLGISPDDLRDYYEDYLNRHKDE